MRSRDEEIIEEVYGNIAGVPAFTIIQHKAENECGCERDIILQDLHKISEYSEKLSCLVDCADNLNPESVRAITIAAEHLSEAWHKLEYEQNI